MTLRQLGCIVTLSLAPIGFVGLILHVIARSNL